MLVSLLLTPPDENKGKNDMLEVMKHILDDQGGQENQGLHDAIKDAMARTEDGEDVDIANLVDQFSKVIKFCCSVTCMHTIIDQLQGFQKDWLRQEMQLICDRVSQQDCFWKCS